MNLPTLSTTEIVSIVVLVAILAVGIAASLAAGDRARFVEGRRGVQGRFVDGPTGAVAGADQLLGDVMSTRGYPVSDLGQPAADISVDHPLVLEN
jgi:hypothetical protein